MNSGLVVGDDVEVLVDRVGGALVPLGLGDALAGGQDVEALVALGAEEVPAALQVADQAECALYWVATPMRRMPELSAFDSAKSMIRVLPPK